jgi:hypothetical protein
VCCSCLLVLVFYCIVVLVVVHVREGGGPRVPESQSQEDACEILGVHFSVISYARVHFLVTNHPRLLLRLCQFLFISFDQEGPRRERKGKKKRRRDAKPRLFRAAQQVELIWKTTDRCNLVFSCVCTVDFGNVSHDSAEALPSHQTLNAGRTSPKERDHRAHVTQQLF